eukprot:11228368-Alexandrium_andersonii.AAC.1
MRTSVFVGAAGGLVGPTRFRARWPRPLGGIPKAENGSRGQGSWHRRQGLQHGQTCLSPSHLVGGEEND